MQWFIIHAFYFAFRNEQQLHEWKWWRLQQHGQQCNEQSGQPQLYCFLNTSHRLWHRRFWCCILKKTNCLLSFFPQLVLRLDWQAFIVHLLSSIIVLNNQICFCQNYHHSFNHFDVHITVKTIQKLCESFFFSMLTQVLLGSMNDLPSAVYRQEWPVLCWFDTVQENFKLSKTFMNVLV